MGSQELASKSKEMVEKYANSAKDSLKSLIPGGKTEKKDAGPPADDEGLKSFNKVEEDLNKKVESKLVADEAAEKARNMCAACSMSLFFGLPLGVMDIFIGFGITAVNISINLG